MISLAQRRSPATRFCCGQGRAGRATKSVMISSGTMASRASASAIAWRDPTHPRLEALGDVRGDHDDADDAGRGGALRRPDRHEGLDEVPGLKLADRRHLLAGESVLELALVHVAGRNVAEHRILHVHELLTPRVEDRDRA